MSCRRSGRRVADQHAEDAPAPRELADRGVRLGVDPGRVEALERLPRAVDDAERGVARPGQLGRRLDDPLEERVERELGGEARCPPRRARAGGRRPRFPARCRWSTRPHGRCTTIRSRVSSREGMPLRCYPCGRPRSRPRVLFLHAERGSRRRDEERRPMALTKEAKQELIVEARPKTDEDTGSTRGPGRDAERGASNELTEHLRTHPKDHYSRRGLLKLVGPAAPVPQLPAAQGPRGLPGPHQGARSPPVGDGRTGREVDV